MTYMCVCIDIYIERERGGITKSKHVLVWKLLLQIVARLGAFSRPARRLDLIHYIYIQAIDLAGPA